MKPGSPSWGGLRPLEGHAELAEGLAEFRWPGSLRLLDFDLDPAPTIIALRDLTVGQAPGVDPCALGRRAHGFQSLRAKLGEIAGRQRQTRQDGCQGR